MRVKPYLFIFIILSLIILSCIKYDEYINPQYRQLLNHYNVGDTIIFKSNLKKYDTILISNLDSVGVRHGLSTLPFKSIRLRIKHMPNNIWHDGFVLKKSSNRYDSIVDLTFIHLYKEQYKNNRDSDHYDIHIRYRDFSGTLNLKKLNENLKDTIMTQRGRGRDILKEESVIEVYWSFDKGMIGYKKNNGEVYHLVDR